MHTDLSPEQAPSASAHCPKPWQQQYVENDLNVQWPKTACIVAKGLGELSESWQFSKWCQLRYLLYQPVFTAVVSAVLLPCTAVKHWLRFWFGVHISLISFHPRSVCPWPCQTYPAHKNPEFPFRPESSFHLKHSAWTAPLQQCSSYSLLQNRPFGRSGHILCHPKPARTATGT